MSADRQQSYGGSILSTPAEGPRMLPLAVTLAIGLLVGFAVGYGVGSREPDSPPPAARAAEPVPQTQTPAGKAYSEQTVAQPQPPPTQQPPATPPPVPSETPAEDRPARPTAATSGHLVVRSTPSRAGVSVNGRWRGRTPLTLEKLPFGKYAVRVIQPGYAVAREEFVLSSIEPARTLSFRLRGSGGPPARSAAVEPQQTKSFTGSIYVDSRPRGARVLLDGRAVGTTPMSIPEVRIGSHVVRLELPEHTAWASTTQVTAGRQARVTGSLERVR